SLPMVAIRGRTFKKPWQRSCLSSKLKSSSAPIGREDSWCFHAVGSSNAPLLGSTAAEGLPRIGRTSIATHWRSCGLPQSASCSENFVIPPDVFGQTLKGKRALCHQTATFLHRGVVHVVVCCTAHVAFWHLRDIARSPMDVRFSNRPSGVKRFQAIHQLQCRCRSRALASLRTRHQGPFHHGIRRRGGTIFRATLPSM